MSEIKLFFTALIGSLLISLLPQAASANHIGYDPYADSVNSFSGTGVINPSNAVGAPDGSASTLAGVNSFITLDMGLGEEGTGNLKVYLGNINAHSDIKLEFLDSRFSVLKSENRSLGVNLNTSTQNFEYSFNSTKHAYRYVRVSSLADAGFSIDAVQAASYIGKTADTDTDGDGRADRFEQHNGTSPEIADKALGNGPGNVASSSSQKVNDDHSGPITDKLEFRKGTRSAQNDSPSFWDRFLLLASSFEFCASGWGFWILVGLLLALALLAYLLGFISGENCEALTPGKRSKRQRMLHRMAKMARRNKL